MGVDEATKKEIKDALTAYDKSLVVAASRRSSADVVPAPASRSPTVKFSSVPFNFSRLRESYLLLISGRQLFTSPEVYCLLDDVCGDVELRLICGEETTVRRWKKTEIWIKMRN